LTRVYRILRGHFANNPFDGEGSYRFGGRWSNPGTRVAYTSEHLSLAMLEYLVHIDPSDPPDDLVFAAADVPDTVSRKTIAAEKLPSTWRDAPTPAEIRAIGDAFVIELKTAILIVPSVHAPGEHNWLLNPRHPEFRRIKPIRVTAFRYDRRFLP